ncbi:MAG TPA: ABC transporter substrate-binding protein [Burkholderiales bacterium]
MTGYRRRFLVCLAGLALLSGNAALAQDKIRVGVLPFSESLGAVIAERQGLFKKAGIDVELSRVGSGAQGVPLLQAGKLDIVLSNTITTLQAIEAGLDAVIVAPSAVVRRAPPDTTSAVLVRKGGPIRTPKDLEGRRFAVNVINSTAWLYAVGFLEKHGVDRSKVRFVEVPFPHMNDPLINGQLDAISQVEPFRTIAEGTGKVEVIGWTYLEVQPNADVTQYLALRSWVDQHRDAAVKFARAVIEGSKYLNENEAAAREANLQFTNLNPALKDKVMLPRFGTEVSAAEVGRTMALMLKFGLMKKPVDISRHVLKID